jgi:hypothetical protein
MIKNIPNRYKINMLLEEIDIEFKNKYDLLYLPIDFTSNNNLGFAFINFINPMHIILFCEIFKGKKWARYNSDKVKLNDIYI